MEIAHLIERYKVIGRAERWEKMIQEIVERQEIWAKIKTKKQYYN